MRFLIVGQGNTLFAYGLFAALVYLLTGWIKSPYAAAMTASALGTVVCITFSFVCHKLFVFRTKGNFFKEYLRAFVVYGGTSLIGFILLPVVMGALNLLVVRRNQSLSGRSDLDRRNGRRELFRPQAIYVRTS